MADVPFTLTFQPYHCKFISNLGLAYRVRIACYKGPERDVITCRADGFLLLCRIGGCTLWNYRTMLAVEMVAEINLPGRRFGIA